MKSLFFALFCLGLFMIPGSTLDAQVRGVCGTMHSHEQDARILRHKAALESGPAIQYRDGVTYVPIKFHLIGRSDGSNRVAESRVMDALCRLNEYFEDQDIQFYSYQGFNYINNTNAYNNPGDFPLILNAVRVGKAMNVYIGDKADPPGGGLGNTLGYYSPGFDWLVVKRSEINATSSTLAHEVGHYFSLAHPFNGWDCTFWQASEHGNPVVLTTAPCSNVPVELVNGSNCATSGDFLCDTPADYNLGFTAGGCSYNGNCMDANGDVLQPMVNNMMGYFTNCANYIFTPMQKALMAQDLASRTGLETNFTPSATVITGTPVLLSPTGGETFAGYNNMLFTWEHVSGADMYFLEIDISPTFAISPIRTVVHGTARFVPLMANRTYHWRVRPFNSYYMCAPNSAAATFNTNNVVSTQEPLMVQEAQIVPNPAVAGSGVQLLLQTTEGFDAQIRIFSLDGQSLAAFPARFNTGANQIEIPTDRLGAGVYLVSVQSQAGAINRKLVLSR